MALSGQNPNIQKRTHERAAVTLQDALDTYILSREHRLKPATAKQYRSILGNYSGTGSHSLWLTSPAIALKPVIKPSRMARSGMVRTSVPCDGVQGRVAMHRRIYGPAHSGRFTVSHTITTGMRKGEPCFPIRPHWCSAPSGNGMARSGKATASVPMILAAGYLR